ncbi:MAG TPA: HAMP domain-containing sensor histidine kinase [Nevskiaceae bacterium]|nr:HAMP domain-containing sensor histidine kinase [Nevskiaceae bacterium]
MINPLKIFACFVKNSHKHAWQVRLAHTYTLATALMLPFTTLALAVIFLIADSPFAARTLPYFAGATLLSWVLYALNKKEVLGFIGIYLMSLYLLLSFGIIYGVGVGPASMVLCSWAIILAGTLCGYRCALVPTTIATVFLFVYRTAELQGIVHPVYVMSHKPTNYSVVILLALLFYVFASISGSLYRLEQTRRELQEAEENFAQQKNQLTNKIKKQSQKLRSAESEKLRQLYRLAEMGEISTVLMHDLANNLTLLALEVDRMETTTSNTSVRRVKNQVKQIHGTLNHTRQQLKGEYSVKLFDLAKETGRTVRLLRPSAKKAHVQLEWIRPDSRERLHCLGEKILFQQLLTNIINNAIESYDSLPPAPHHKVSVSLEAVDTSLRITVTDWGKGIAPEDTDKVFEPFYTTKQSGMGMGMYLTKRLIASGFGGTVELKSTKHQTSFVVVLPQIPPGKL